MVILIGISYLLPNLWKWLEQFNPSIDYRLPYNLSNDYWMFTRWSKYACSNYPVLIIGDSVVWGQYVTMEQTLSHYLNEMEGKNIFANMGVDGIHPAAMLGLIKYYGKAISNKRVILHFNPLWMSSKEHDLRGEEEFRFNHPRLVPQFFPKIACYKASFAQRMSVVTERSFSFSSWINHIRMNYFENMDIQNWTMQNPYKNPLKAITLEIPIPENKPQSKPVTWVERGMKKQDFSWVQVEESFQWNSFMKVIKILKARNNKVFVIIGPFNPYILTEESLIRYNNMKSKMENWLEGNGISYRSISDLPSEYYADASHPLKEGYAKSAEELFATESFRKWLENFKEKKFEK
ncbi:hypothetical protein FJZ31_24205 [Candidatus Poribacteria bacterium]|nr:hypothetical protein [Candidatus Poribacteria bacterium]